MYRVLVVGDNRACNSPRAYASRIDWGGGGRVEAISWHFVAERADVISGEACVL